MPRAFVVARAAPSLTAAPATGGDTVTCTRVLRPAGSDRGRTLRLSFAHGRAGTSTSAGEATWMTQPPSVVIVTGPPAGPMVKPAAEVRGAQPAHRPAAERVVATLGPDLEARLCLRDDLVEEVALPRRATATAAVPPVDVPAAGPTLGRHDDRVEPLEILRDVSLVGVGPPRVRVRQPRQDEEDRVRLLGVVPVRQDRPGSRRPRVAEPAIRDLAASRGQRVVDDRCRVRGRAAGARQRDGGQRRGQKPSPHRLDVTCRPAGMCRAAARATSARRFRRTSLRPRACDAPGTWRRSS